MNIVCCKSCLVGCSDISNKEIELQKEKYDGVYICKNCEDSIEQIASCEFGTLETRERERCLITKNGIYIDKGMRSKNERFLGFGGRLFLIIETAQEGFLKKKKVYLTNNLFSIRSIHPSLVDKYKHNINAEIINVDWDSCDKLKNQLEKM